MNPSNEHDREEAAFDALLVAAYRQDTDANDCPPPMVGPEPVLSEEDQQALDALGSDLVSQIAAGTWQHRFDSASDHPHDDSSEEREQELAGAFHRGDEDEQLTDNAREEIERRIQELDLANENGKARAAE